MTALRAGTLMLRMAKCLARPVDLESRPLSTLAFPPHGLPWLSLIAVARFQECLKRQEVGAASSGGLGPEAGTGPLLPYSFVKESRGQPGSSGAETAPTSQEKESQRTGGLY